MMQLILSPLSVYPVDYDWLLSSVNLVLHLAVSMVFPISGTLFIVRLFSESNIDLNFDE